MKLTFNIKNKQKVKSFVYLLKNNAWFAGAGSKCDIEKVTNWLNGKTKTKPKLKNTNKLYKIINKS